MENGVPTVHNIKEVIRINSLRGVRYLELDLSYRANYFSVKLKKNEILNFFFTFLKVSICRVSFMDSQFYVVWILLHQLLRQFFAPQVRHLLLVLIKLNFIKLPTSSNDTPVSSARSIPILIMLEDRSIATTFTPYS